MKQSYYRCLLCGGPTKKEGSRGKPPIYCNICTKAQHQKVDRESRRKQREYRRKHRKKLYQQAYREVLENDWNENDSLETELLNALEFDSFATPYGYIKQLGTKETTNYYLDQREKKLLRDTKDEKWKKKD